MRSRARVTPGRWVAAIGGAGLVAAGIRRLADNDRPKGSLMTAVGAGLVWWGANSHSAAYPERNADTRVRLGGDRGIIVEEVVAINDSPASLYIRWRDFECLPVIFPDLISVRILHPDRSHWVAKGPGGRRVEWTAKIINDIPGELMAWRTVGPADLVSAGSVHFTPAPGNRGAIVRVRLQYDPSAGKLGAAVAWLLGHGFSHNLREGLRHFKQITEAGEIPRNQPQPRGAA